MISIPPGLRRLTLALWLCVPVAILETLLVSRASVTGIAREKIIASGIPTAMACALLGFPVLFAWRPVWGALGCVFGAWLGSAAWMAFRDHNFGLALFAVLLAVFQSLYLVWLRIELGRSFCDPRVRWYHGLPTPIPGLVCDLGTSDRFRVSALDRKGIFLYRETGGATPDWVVGRQARELALCFRDRRVRCRGIPVRALRRAGEFRGVGLRFAGMSPDMLKQLGDFVEVLKGEGYVQ